MKPLLSILSCILIMTVFTQCSSAQFDKKPPFTISKASKQNWVGGRPGVKGTLITLELAADDASQVAFDSIFYQNKKIQLEQSKDDTKLILKGNFIVNTTQKEQLTMHSDSREEMRNSVGGNLSKIPFELADNECVISYLVKDKKQYFKVENIKKIKTLFYQ